MTLRARLAVGLAVIALVLLTPLVVTRSAMLALHRDVRQLQSTEFAASLKLGRLRDAISEVRDRELALPFVGSDDVDRVHEQLVRSLRSAHTLADTLARASRGNAAPTSGDSAAKALVLSLDLIGPAIDQEYRAVRAGRDTLADSISRFVVGPAMDSVESALPLMERELRDRTTGRVVAAEKSLQEAEDNPALTHSFRLEGS